MADVLEYPEGTPFAGTIGRAASESSPAWPQPPRGRPGHDGVESW